MLNDTITNQQSPVTVKKVEKTPAFTPIKSCDKLRIILITQGSANAIIDGETTTLTADDIAVVCPKSLLAFTSYDNLQYVELTLDILSAQDKLGRYLHFINGSLGVPVFVKKGESEHAEIFSAVNKLTNSQNNLIENAESILIALFNHRKKNATHNMSKNKQRYAIETILQRISLTTVTIEICDVANACGYSEFYTMKLFKQFTGETIVDYSNKCRIYSAYNKLLTTNKSVREIAQEVGFTNISYFNRQFKRTYGITPLTMRNLNRAD